MIKKYDNNPYMLINLRHKTRAKIGFMIMDIIKKNPEKKMIWVKNITKMWQKYNIWNKTIAKYLKKSIFWYWEKKTKIFVIREKEIEFWNIVDNIEKRFKDATPEEIEIFKFFIAYLWKKL